MLDFITKLSENERHGERISAASVPNLYEHGAFSMAAKDLPSPEVLRQLLRYEPETGKLFWLHRPEGLFSNYRIFRSWNSRYAGQEAFIVAFQGYKAGAIRKHQLLSHRVIWAMQMDMWPDGDIDHINGVRDDNRMSNLRAVDRATNMRNKRKLDANTSGHTGVDFHKQSGLWRARIRHNGRDVTKLFAEKSAAVAHRKVMDVKYGYHPNHGRDK